METKNEIMLLSAKKKRAPAFSDREDEALIAAYAKRRRILESSTKDGIKPSHKQACWAEISAGVNAVYELISYLQK